MCWSAAGRLSCAAAFGSSSNSEVRQATSLFRALLSMLPGLVVGGLLALLGLVPALALTWNESPEIVAEANRIYVFERLPHHLALLTMPPEDIAIRLIAAWSC